MAIFGIWKDLWIFEDDQYQLLPALREKEINGLMNMAHKKKNVGTVISVIWTDFSWITTISVISPIPDSIKSMGIGI